ncbi:collagen-like triple helix repeat-containing protein [Zobellia laminariae]|uniref:collagen-like triple helix repeat-containing protein n=1 Tax=Zobellia laminariae TaxID=248906 RepID=UPI0026F469D1|nr:collagen-like protein [Zobellia laminariae]WKX75058.1 collagen-like protein [Zobellia laminariae]
MVYNTDTNCVYSYNGANWVNLCNSSSGTFSFVDNNDGTFTINNNDGTSYTSSDLTGPQGEKGEQGEQGPAGADGVNSGAELEQIVIVAYNKQTQFNTPFLLMIVEKLKSIEMECA